jgi:hypothetical protein
MSESWLEHLEKAWEEVKEDDDVKQIDIKECYCTGFTKRGKIVTCNCDVKEMPLKLTELSLEESNQDSWTQVRLKTDEGLKR